MITDSFDISSEPIVTPEAFFGKREKLCDICIATYSKLIFEDVLERYQCEKLCEIEICDGNRSVYGFEHNGVKIGFFLSHIGSALAGNNIVEVGAHVGATKYIFFGSAGSLDGEATKGKFVVPTSACRDEGMSYHYAPPSDYIDIKNSGKVARIFDGLKVPYVRGKIWTTDALYRETKKNAALRKNEGCIAVEMETAGLEAVCDFHGFELYVFLMTGDVLDTEEYNRGELSGVNHCISNFDVALKIAEKIGGGETCSES